MKVRVSYALLRRQVAFDVEVPDGATVKDAIARSKILEQFPEIDLKRQKVGIYSKVATLETVLADGDRVEIYRPITADPKKVSRKNKADGGSDGED